MNQLTRTLRAKSTRELAPTLIKSQARETLETLVRMLGINTPRPLDESELTPPDSEIVQRADDYARKIVSPVTYLHSVRTYQFGVAIAKHAGQEFDREVFYLASILHDLGLGEKFRGPGDFELNGARAAHEFLNRETYDTLKANLIHEAIALHTSVGELDEKEPEVRLVHLGAGLDVIGIQRQNVAKSTLKGILQANSYKGFQDEFIKHVNREAKEKPSCHFASHVRLGFAGMIKSNPLGKLAKSA